MFKNSLALKKVENKLNIHEAGVEIKRKRKRTYYQMVNINKNPEKKDEEINLVKKVLKTE